MEDKLRRWLDCLAYMQICTLGDMRYRSYNKYSNVSTATYFLLPWCSYSALIVRDGNIIVCLQPTHGQDDQI